MQSPKSRNEGPGSGVRGSLDVLLEQHVDASLEDEPVVDGHLADLGQLVPVSVV